MRPIPDEARQARRRELARSIALKAIEDPYYKILISSATPLEARLLQEEIQKAMEKMIGEAKR